MMLTLLMVLMATVMGFMCACWMVMFIMVLAGSRPALPV